MWGEFRLWGRWLVGAILVRLCLLRGRVVYLLRDSFVSVLGGVSGAVVRTSAALSRSGFGTLGESVGSRSGRGTG